MNGYAFSMKRSSPVKLLVRNPRSGEFLQSTGDWTQGAERAFNFPNPLNAIHLCLEKDLQNVELILRFEGDTSDRCLPLAIG